MKSLSGPSAERIGHETVTYVSNIFKYYVTYRLLTEQKERRGAAKAGVRTRAAGRSQ